MYHEPWAGGIGLFQANMEQQESRENSQTFKMTRGILSEGGKCPQ